MGVGKTAAQASHASLKAYEAADSRDVDEWRSSGMKKIVLAADSKQKLLELKREAERRGLATGLVRDAGHTQVESGSVTALAVGPGRDEEVDRVTGDLGLV